MKQRVPFFQQFSVAKEMPDVGVEIVQSARHIIEACAAGQQLLAHRS
ncbi:hypothetical protein [Burkholderia sp. LMG 32019]